MPIRWRATGRGDPPSPRHIVDQLIEERAPRLLRWAPTGWLLRHLLYPQLGYHAAKAAIDRVHGLAGAAVMDFAAGAIAMHVRTLGASRLPADGRVVLAVNHPTGLADGVALWWALSPLRPDLKILANQDVLRIAPALADVFIPVEWIKAKRRPATSRRVLVDVIAALRREEAVTFFPSGRLAYLSWRGLVERPWQPAVVTMARRLEAPIVPVHIRARNSPLFYALSQLGPELRDITLFHELLNKRGQRFELTVGQPIDPARLPAEAGAAVRALQHHVEHELPRASRTEPRLTGAAALDRGR